MRIQNISSVNYNANNYNRKNQGHNIPFGLFRDVETEERVETYCKTKMEYSCGSEKYEAMRRCPFMLFYTDPKTNKVKAMIRDDEKYSKTQEGQIVKQELGFLMRDDDVTGDVLGSWNGDVMNADIIANGIMCVEGRIKEATEPAKTPEQLKAEAKELQERKRIHDQFMAEIDQGDKNMENLKAILDAGFN